MPALSHMNPPDAHLVQKAAEALNGSLKLTDEIIRFMNLIESGIQPSPGIIKAMRRYLQSVTIFVDEKDI